MFASIRTVAASRVLAVGFFGALLTLSGCSDWITFSDQSRAEGMRLYTEKAYGDAAGSFRNAIRQEPRDYRSHFYLGVCYEQMRLYQNAFTQYYTTLEVMNRQANKYDANDQVLRQTVLDTLANAIARYDDHEVELNKAEARAKTGQRAEDWFLVAKVYRLKGDADMALDAYRRAAHWDTTNFAIRKELGLYLLDPLNQPTDSEYFLRQANRLNPDDPAVRNALARMGVTPLPADRQNGAGVLPPYQGPLPTASAPPVGPAVTPRPANEKPIPNSATVQNPRD